MFKSKGVVLGATVALVGAALLVAGMAVKTTSGAGTDGCYCAPTGGFPDTTGSPPASQGETPGTQPGTQPTGNPAGIPTDTNAGGAGAGALLPNAGFGVTGDDTGFGSAVVLLALAGAAVAGAGALSLSARRRD
jgi:hypothetical protein